MAKNVIDMTGKVVLVTGGSRGLGRAMALGFAEAGANVAVASRKISSCLKTVAEIENYGVKGLAQACHVGDWDQVTALADAVYTEFGKIDVLINNAGMSPLYDRPVDVTEALYDKVMNVNLKGPFRLCAYIGERMIADGGGSIINISSIAAIRPRKDIITYAAAKAGLNAMTEGMANAMGPKVRVNCIMPGPFLTDISKAWDMEKFKARAEERIALKRGGEAEEIVGAALYLASDQASYTTGAVIRIDGGSVY
jgi:NAD(P)-dependent dehydrogenase (short-subunit alcohol dehydrogenase family)